MLTEEEKTRIRAEEVFRLEVRGELEAKKPHPSLPQRLGAWLNSAFALWLLSSILLTGLTAAYTAYQNHHAEQLRRAETEQRLDTEISGRMSDALAALQDFKSQLQNGTWTQGLSDTYGLVPNYLDNNACCPRVDLSTYPEYRSRNFRSLLFELSAVVNPAALPKLEGALKGYMHFRDLATNAPGGAVNGKLGVGEETQAVNYAIEFLTHQMQGRWRSAMMKAQSPPSKPSATARNSPASAQSQ
ncbi:MAG: hypothetical protein ACRES7_07650 [Gammaproteobacteria bacterium]